MKPKVQFQGVVISEYLSTRAGLARIAERIGVEVEVEMSATEVPSRSRSRVDWDVAVLDVATSTMSASLRAGRALRDRPEPIPVIGVHCSGPRPAKLNLLLGTDLTAYVSIAQSDMSLRSALAALSTGDSLVQVPRQDLVEAVGVGPVLGEIDTAITGLLVRGLTDEEVGTRVGLQPASVKHRVQELYKAHGLTNRCQLGCWLCRWGLVDPEDLIF